MRAGIGLAIGIVLALGWQARGAQGVNDPYLWLEEVHGEKPLAWVRQENAKTLGVLTADPDYKADYESILAVLDAEDRIPFGSLDHRFVFNFWQDAQHPKGLWRRTTIADYANAAPHWEILLDIDKLAADERQNWVFKGTDCTESLTRCLVSLSRGGGDAVVIREFDLASKRFVNDGFTLAEAKSNAAYVDDDTILFATNFGPGSLTTSGYPRIVKLWKRGTAIAHAKMVFEGKAADVSVDPIVFRGNSGALALVSRAPSFFEAEYFLVNPDGTIVKVPVPLSAVLQGVHYGQLIATLRADWTPPSAPAPLPKGALIALSIRSFARDHLPLKPQLLYAPGARASIEQVSVGRDAVYAAITENVKGEVRAFRLDPVKYSWSSTRLDLPEGGSADIVSTNDDGPEAQFRYESFLAPTTLYADSGNDKPVAIKALPARFDASKLVSEQFEAVSKDGTKIPYFVTRPATLHGPTPTVLYGYGGFEISLTPTYSANFGRLWLAKGGIYVVANIRGGGEFGPAWHQAALGPNRQKAYEDFQAVAADLVARGLTTPKQLGVMGGSNGGLLVSATMVERPDLFGAVVCQVPLIDMLRYTHIGAGASWIGEYGDPDDGHARAWILKYSPYQNVKPGVKYPPVFFVTATSDDRVTPVHARKMAAKMIAQGDDVMFYENTDGGHAAAADHRQAAEMWALSFVYLKRELGLGK